MHSTAFNRAVMETLRYSQGLTAAIYHAYAVVSSGKLCSDPPDLNDRPDSIHEDAPTPPLCFTTRSIIRRRATCGGTYPRGVWSRVRNITTVNVLHNRITHPQYDRLHSLTFSIPVRAVLCVCDGCADDISKDPRADDHLLRHRPRKLL